MVAVELVLPARRDYLSVLRAALTAAIEAAGTELDRATLDDLRLAVTEACANAIDAHESPDDPVLVRADLGAHHAVISVQDSGGGFDPGAVAPIPPAAHPERLQHERGLGLSLIQHLADQVEFRASGEGTLVRMRFGPAPARPSGAAGTGERP